MDEDLLEEIVELNARISDLQSENQYLEGRISDLEDDVYEAQRELQLVDDELCNFQELLNFDGDLTDALLEFYRAYVRGEDMKAANMVVEHALTGKDILL